MCVLGKRCYIAGMINEFTEIPGTNESPCQSNPPPLHLCNDDLSVLDGPVQSGPSLPLIQRDEGPVPRPDLGTLVSLSAEMTTITQADSRHRLQQTEPSATSYITSPTVLYHQRFAHKITSTNARTRSLI